MGKQAKQDRQAEQRPEAEDGKGRDEDNTRRVTAAKAGRVPVEFDDMDFGQSGF